MPTTSGASLGQDIDIGLLAPGVQWQPLAMPPGQDDITDRWASKLEGTEPAKATDNEALRKAMAINPELFDKKAQAAQKKPLAETLVSEKQKYSVERKLIKDEIAKLQANERALLTKVLGKINNAVLESDPELNNKATDEALKKESAFLTEIGFSKLKLKPAPKK
jgi:hypothetical protein